LTPYKYVYTTKTTYTFDRQDLKDTQI
jgi:hypothetical protein